MRYGSTTLHTGKLAACKTPCNIIVRVWRTGGWTELFSPGARSGIWALVAVEATRSGLTGANSRPTYRYDLLHLFDLLCACRLTLRVAPTVISLQLQYIW